MLETRAINLELLERGERPPLPKTIVSSLERSQRLLNQMKNINEANSQMIQEEVNALNLRQHIPEMAKNIA